MSQKTARYNVSFGLSGCYMPDSIQGPYEFATRRALANFIREEIAQNDWPAYLAREVKIRNLWRFIARNGASVAHFAIKHKGYEIAFHGLTRAEFDAAERENEFA